LIKLGNFIDVFLALHVSGAYGFLHRVCGWIVVLRAAAQVVCMMRTAPYTRTCELY